MGSRLLVYALAAQLALGVLSGAARAQPAQLHLMDPQAREHLDRGVAHFEAKRYEAAIAEFKSGYAIEPRRELLFAWAQAERLRGNCAAAVGLYRRVLEQASSSDVEQARVTEYHLKRCQAVLPEPWYRDLAGGILVGSGVVSVGLGVVMIVISVGTEGDAEKANAYTDYSSLISDARLERTIGISGVAVGTALIASGIVRYVWRGAPDAHISIEPDRVSLVVGGRFWSP